CYGDTTSWFAHPPGHRNAASQRKQRRFFPCLVSRSQPAAVPRNHLVEKGISSVDRMLDAEASRGERQRPRALHPPGFPERGVSRVPAQIPVSVVFSNHAVKTHLAPRTPVIRTPRAPRF